MVTMLEKLGASVLAFVSALGQLGIFTTQSLIVVFTPPLKVSRFIRQMHFIGVSSLLVIVLTGLFTGMVLSFQGYYTLKQYGSEAYLGAAVTRSLIMELGPVLAALMVTGRAGSSLAAEIGIMRITEQIDALRVMALNPLRYLVAPNMLAGTIAMPLLSSIFSVVGIFGGYIVGVLILGIGTGTYFRGMVVAVYPWEIAVGVYKALVFGFVVALIACYQGYYAGYGAEGVSKATTEAVVYASVTVLVMDYFLNAVLL